MAINLKIRKPCERLFCFVHPTMEGIIGKCLNCCGNGEEWKFF
jgi:hypothetical protein